VAESIRSCCTIHRDGVSPARFVHRALPDDTFASSIKLKTFGDGTRSIAHFYRHIEIYPCLDPSAVLATLEQPLQSTNSQTVFLGGSGKVKITAILHRRVWVAGQRCYLKISINNHSTKKIKSLALTLNRNVTVFQPNPDLDPISSPKRWGSDMLDTDGILPRSASEAGELAAFEVEDYDACQTSTSRKQVAECTLELGQKGERGCVTAKGWWTGVEAGASVELSHFILIPVRLNNSPFFISYMLNLSHYIA